VLTRVLLFLLVSGLLSATPLEAASVSISGDGERLLGPGGVPIFVTALNYEGPADRAWQMWDPDKFDAGLIEADLVRAASAGARALRIFIQAPLATEIAANRWDKLDQVVSLAEKHQLQFIVSLHDYGERDLGNVSATASRIAQRYRGRSGILAYDIKNEPRFGDLALSRYAAPVPLQQRGLIDTLGERLPRDQLAAFRASDDGAKTVPSSLSDDDAWIYVNNLRLYREFVADASSWARDRSSPATTLDFMDDAASQKWAPLLTALNVTLQAWLAPQVQAIRQADPAKPVTVEHVDAVLAKLPANDMLDYQTLHRYPAVGAGSVRGTLNLVAALQRAHPGKPYLLGEFGYATESLDPDTSALQETAVLLGLLSQHGAGGTKWMLNDLPAGYNMRERTMGAFRQDGTAKPIVQAVAALRAYLDQTGSGPGTLSVDNDPDTGLRYVYRAADALLLGGKHVDAGPASMTANSSAQLFLTWTDSRTLQVWASAPMQATIDLGKLVGGGSVVTLNLDHAGSSSLPIGAQAQHAPDYDIAGGHFFTQTNGRAGQSSGFRVTNEDGMPFWDAFQALGGVDALGYPVTRRFEMDGFTVQAFQKAVLQWRPDQGNQFWFLNTFDALHDRGRDDWLEVYRQTPRPFDTAPDSGLAWDKVVARHLALLDKVPAPLKARFLADPAWIDHYGLPVATREYPNSVVVRAQRATFQYW
jgi:hypothetical protein